ncbi:MAG TPA: C1 family peptidase [Thermoanaerobaculaceae bacterium]|nr:C1 family peptidase [Thermoanaerobaculaceae bacterium]HRS14850.1 C1 family peptidase [Thermoanaerobaculaceae bacterium]
MRTVALWCRPLGAVALVLATGAAAAPPPTPAPADRAVYEPRHKDPVLEEMEKANEARDKAASEATDAIRAAQKARRDKERGSEKTLRFDMSRIVKPASPAAFKQAFHFPPQAQYLTGTCWSFSTTSFLESEVFRLTGQKIKLSEMYPVYWEYVEKMRRFVRERGDSPIAEGSESNAFTRLLPDIGMVPAEAYPGVLAADGRHDHSRLIARLQNLASWVNANDEWDEELVLAMTRVILDRELGPPPARFEYNGVTYTPREFLSRVLKLEPADYVDVMSTLSAPFWQRAEYKVPDNWWHDASYVNVPLDDWYAAIRGAVQQGYTLVIGGDVSEPGINGFEDIAIIPDFDIPAAYINQSSRELRFDNHTSEDDHGIHLVGMTQTGGHDWFLIKDSGRSSRWGKFAGYYFYRDDFVKLKMLTFTVHKDAVAHLLAKVGSRVE